MTAVPFDELARLWQESAPAASDRSIRELADRARARARRQSAYDYGLAILATLSLAYIVATAPTLFTTATALISFPVMAWPTWRRYRIAQIFSAYGAPEEEMVRNLTRIASAEYRYRMLLAVTMLPLSMGTWLAKVSTRVEGDIARIPEGIAMIHPVRIALTAIALVGIAWWTFRGYRRARNELAHLKALSLEYEADARQIAS